MNESRFAWKVGLFVAAGLLLIALLILNFSKGITLFQHTYNLTVRMRTIAGLLPTADVMMAGVPIGKVVNTALSDDGRIVDVKVQILGQYLIRTNANFHIDSLGFLGDQYIEVTPAAHETNPPPPFLKDGDTVIGEEPFTMAEAIRSTSGLLDQAKQSLKSLDQAITSVNRTILTESTLTNFTEALSNFDVVTESAVVMAHDIEGILVTNTPPVNEAVANLRGLSQKLNGMADQLDQVILTNRGGVNEAVQNLRDASAEFKQLAMGLQAGQGLAGGLLKDSQMKTNVSELISNANAMTANFSAFGATLNQEGLWRALWKPKHPPTNSPAH